MPEQMSQELNIDRQTIGTSSGADPLQALIKDTHEHSSFYSKALDLARNRVVYLLYGQKRIGLFTRPSSLYYR
jgi:hypothetical protein